MPKDSDRGGSSVPPRPGSASACPNREAGFGPMIDDIHLLLRRLLLDRIDQLVDESQVSFEPPNADWRSMVSNLTVDGDPVNAVNVYLVDLRERRDVRSTAVEARVENGLVMQRQADPWVELHYVISAWTPQETTEGAEPTLIEHELLAEVVAVL